MKIHLIDCNGLIIGSGNTLQGAIQSASKALNLTKKQISEMICEDYEGDGSLFLRTGENVNGYLEIKA